MKNERVNTPTSAELSTSAHLEKGIKPIIVCIGTPEDFETKKDSPKKTIHILGLDNVQNIDWVSGSYEFQIEKPLTAGPKTYIISPIDDFNKYSKSFTRCVGLVITGVDKETGKNISFLLHSDPVSFLFSEKNNFTTDLNKQLVKIKERCKPGTIDAVIIGGRYFGDDELDNYQVSQLYPDAINLLGTETKQVLGFEPIVINGPKNSREKWDEIYYDNNHRKLYFIRPKVNKSTSSFSSSDVSNQESKWK